jgi:hypothetical protein
VEVLHRFADRVFALEEFGPRRRNADARHRDALAAPSARNAMRPRL